MKQNFLAFSAAGCWISISEFVRNELIFKSYWVDKYSSMGLVFPSEPVNNALWGLWSFTLAGVIVYLSLKLRLFETIAIAWIMAFIMMWMVIGNLNVLPPGLLFYAVPLSILEVSVAAFLGYRITDK